MFTTSSRLANIEITLRPEIRPVPLRFQGFVQGLTHPKGRRFAPFAALGHFQPVLFPSIADLR